MNLEFCEDDKLIQNQVDKYLSNHCGIEVVRRVLDGEKNIFRGGLARAGEMGLMGINVRLSMAA